MRPLAGMSLRGRFLVVVLLSAVLPLGLVGIWILESSRAAGVELVRARLTRELNEAALSLGRSWSRYQSALLDLVETPEIQSGLQPGGAATGGGAGPDRDGVARRWQEVADFVWHLEIVDGEGRRVVSLPDDLGEARSARSPPPGFLHYEFPARERFTGTALGTVRVRFRSDALAGTRATGAGSVLALVDRRNGTSLTPLPLDPTLLDDERFSLAGEPWLSVRRDLVDPPVRLLMAAPLGPVTTPLDDAARRGALALLLVLIVTFALVTVFSRRLTRSLEGLSSTAGAIAAGELEARATEEGPPEVRATAAAFNAMTATLRETLDRSTQREALAAVGEFAASLAHEVRNPLTAVRLDLERSARKLPDDADGAVELTKRALAEIDRLNASVSGFLRVARSGSPTFRTMDLHGPVEAAVHAAAPRLDERGCTVRLERPSGPLTVRGDGGSLEQLILNLLLNAAEASPAGGVVRLFAESTPRGVRVGVEDQGPGVAPEDRDRIFEPFFTTKGEGTGLGLAVARRIARAHGSELEVASGSQGGALFSFLLPTETHGRIGS